MNFHENELRIGKALEALNYEDISQLFDQIPSKFRYPDIDFPKGIDELSLRRHIESLAKQNSQPPISFCGAGFYHHYIPAVVDYISSLGNFATAYTPYQAEVSQGTLQTLFEYQSYLAELTAMDVVNASHYDGATAFAEALRILLYTNSRRGKKIIIFSLLNPEYVEIIQTYMQGSDAEVEYRDIFDKSTFSIPDDCCAVSLALPDYHGRVADISGIGELCKKNNVLFHIHADPLLCSLIEPPGNLGADIYTGEGQPLGIPVSMGGPYLGIFAVTSQLQRKIPGRLVGETCDKQNRRGFVLALSTREQHIRREKAISNICTNQGLMALRAIVYMAAMGRHGLETAAQKCISNIQYLMDNISTIPGFKVDRPELPHFREFMLACDFPVEKLLNAGGESGILPGLSLSENTLLVSSTEKHSSEDLDAYLELCSRVAKNERQ